MISSRLRRTIPARFGWGFLLLALGTALGAETIRLPDAGGAELELELYLPPAFDATREYSVLVGPGDYYWQDRAAHPGWILVVSDAFWGDHRIPNSKIALAWLRNRYRLRHDGFHIVGWSANSAGVFDIAMTHSDQFLSVTGIAGMPGRGSDDDLDRLADIRVQFIVGEHDPYWRSGSERWHQRMTARGIDSTLEIIPGGEHVMPELADEPLFERMNRLVESLANR